MAELNRNNRLAGDRATSRVASWFEQYASELRRFLVRQHAPADDVEDLLHDVFVVALKRTRDYQEQGQARAYLYQIARHIVLSHRRKRRPDSGGEVDQVVCRRVVECEQQAIDSEQAERLRRYLHRIRPEQQVVIQLRTTKGLSFKEIAQTLDVSLNTVLSHFHRGISRIKTLAREQSARQDSVFLQLPRE